MPSPATLLSKYRDVGFSQSCVAQTRAPRNKLKKLPPVGYPEKAQVTFDLCHLLGSTHSLENIPRPPRPPRTSRTDFPDPALPTYKYEPFDFPFDPIESLDEKTELKDCDTTSESASECWSLAYSTPSRYPSEPERMAVDRCNNGPAAAAAAPATTAREPPQYDRASRLAEAYRSLLPDLDTIEDSEARVSQQKTPQPLRRFRLQPRTPSLHLPVNFTARDSPGDVSKPTQTAAAPEQPNTTCGFPLRTKTTIMSRLPKAPSITGSSMGSSITITDTEPIIATRPPSTGDVGTQCTRISADDQEEGPEARNQTIPPFTTSQDAQQPSISPRRPARPPPSSDYVGLQICSELLTDELAKAFFRRHPDEKKARPSKLQVLLLIEAYEAMLDTCRREASAASSGDEPDAAGAGAGCDRKRHTGDAVRILDHWLDSLYVIYDQAFGEEKGGGGGGGGGGGAEEGG